jgi:hypothetical protein
MVELAIKVAPNCGLKNALRRMILFFVDQAH